MGARDVRSLVATELSTGLSARVTPAYNGVTRVSDGTLDSGGLLCSDAMYSGSPRLRARRVC